MSKRMTKAGGFGSVVATVGLLSGCLQTAPVVVTPQDQAARLVYACPSNKILDVTRVQGNRSALVTVDGRTIQLHRVDSGSSSERYSNRLQTLTLFGNSATLETLGKASYGPCVAGTVPPQPGAVVEPPAREERHSTD